MKDNFAWAQSLHYLGRKDSSQPCNWCKIWEYHMLSIQSYITNSETLGQYKIPILSTIK